MAQKVIKKSNVNKDNVKKTNTGLLRKGGTSLIHGTAQKQASQLDCHMGQRGYIRQLTHRNPYLFL